jgi:hypothetical protein
MEGLDAIALSPDEINIDAFTIHISNGVEVETRQVSVDIGEAIEMALFQQTLAIFPEQYIIDLQIVTTPALDYAALGYGDLANALIMKPAFYAETNLGTSLYYKNGLTYFIEDQQGIYGSIGFDFPEFLEEHQSLDIDQFLSELSTGRTNNYEIEHLGDESVHDADFATMMLTNGFNTGPDIEWFYVLDNTDVDTLSATADLTHIDSFIISVTNGTDIKSQQVDINIFEDIGPPFDLNTSLGQHQVLFVNSDSSEDLTTTSVDIV